MKPCTTIEQAIERQTGFSPEDWDAPGGWRKRYASLKEGFEYVEDDVAEDVREVATGETHEHQMQWFADGRVLLCTICFVDGT